MSSERVQAAWPARGTSFLLDSMAILGTATATPRLAPRHGGGVTFALSRLSGTWRTLAMVRRYSHLAPDHLRDAVERLVPSGLTGGAKSSTNSTRTSTRD